MPVASLREFIDYVKAHPGEINYGSSGVGSIHHLSMEALKASAHLNMTHIPYRGTGQSVPALLGNHVQVLFAAYPSLAGAVESKKVKLLAQNGEGRWFQAPDVPAVSELVPNFDSGDHRRPVHAARPAAADRRQDHRRGHRCGQLAGSRQADAGRWRRAGRRQRRCSEKALQREIEKVTEVVKSAGIQPQ